jgi:hypothetical protein
MTDFVKSLNWFIKPIARSNFAVIDAQIIAHTDGLTSMTTEAPTILETIDRRQFDQVLATVCAGVSARQVGTGGWRLIGPLAPLTPTSVGRFRTERKALEQRVAHSLVRLLGWELSGDDHYRALRRIQLHLNDFKKDLPTPEALLTAQLELEGYRITSD